MVYVKTQGEKKCELFEDDRYTAPDKYKVAQPRNKKYYCTIGKRKLMKHGALVTICLICQGYWFF